MRRRVHKKRRCRGGKNESHSAKTNHFEQNRSVILSTILLPCPHAGFPGAHAGVQGFDAVQSKPLVTVFTAPTNYPTNQRMYHYIVAKGPAGIRSYHVIPLTFSNGSAKFTVLPHHLTMTFPWVSGEKVFYHTTLNQPSYGSAQTTVLHPPQQPINRVRNTFQAGRVS